MKEKLTFIMSGADVKRYHTVPTIQIETVGHHSHGVACLAAMLDPNASRELLMAALMHDLSEHQTGDIPAPAKREYGIGDQVNNLELRLMKEAGLPFPGLSKEDSRTLKLADIAQGALFCANEISMGNTRMNVVFDRYISYAEQLVLVGREKEIFKTIKELKNEQR